MGGVRRPFLRPASDPVTGNHGLRGIVEDRLLSHAGSNLYAYLNLRGECEKTFSISERLSEASLREVEANGPLPSKQIKFKTGV